MKRAIREQACEMRRRGETITAIASTLNVSKGSVSMWVRDIPLTEAQIEAIRLKKARFAAQNKGSQTNKTKYRAVRKEYQEQGRATARLGRPLHLAGCMLYWAEGGKLRNSYIFVNTDPNMHRLMMRFLRDELHIHDSEITLYIHCHFSDRESQKKIEEYWLEVLQLPASCLRKTQYKKGSETRKNTLVNGVCGVRVNRSQLVQHIYGAIQEYGGFENDLWLEGANK